MSLYSLGIVAHPSRRDMAETLAAQVAADLTVYDNNHQGERWCHTETLRQLATLDSDWCVWLEDDAQPIEDFRASLHRALTSTRPAIVSLYLGTGNWAGVPRSQAATITELIETADRTDAHWITTNALYHAVGICVPTAWAPSLITHLEQAARPTDRTITA